MSITLVLGGARSGKSAYAEQAAAASGKNVVYLATATAGDSEMQARIQHHRQQRPAHWRTVETPLALADALQQASTPGTVVVVDCITLWLSNLMFDEQRELPDIGPFPLPARLQQERSRLLALLPTLAEDVWLVSNELGMGIVPLGAGSRAFADEAGRTNQALARIADQVVMLIAGLPLTLKARPA